MQPGLEPFKKGEEVAEDWKMGEPWSLAATASSSPWKQPGRHHVPPETATDTRGKKEPSPAVLQKAIDYLPQFSTMFVVIPLGHIYLICL